MNHWAFNVPVKIRWRCGEDIIIIILIVKRTGEDTGGGELLQYHPVGQEVHVPPGHTRLQGVEHRPTHRTGSWLTINQAAELRSWYFFDGSLRRLKGNGSNFFFLQINNKIFRIYDSYIFFFFR